MRNLFEHKKKTSAEPRFAYFVIAAHYVYLAFRYFGS